MTKINLLDEKIIRKNLSDFEGGFGDAKDDGRQPWARYSSFDYCFNYFQRFKNKKDLANKENIQNSCLHLAFYLASWGMLRNSFLLQKSIKFYEPLIKYISEQDDSFWKIDVPSYSEANIERLVKCGNDIKTILSAGGKYKVSDTLITKIMLGVFGNVPAFDAYFKNGSDLGTFNKKALVGIRDFYAKDGYSELISCEANRIKTFEYHNNISNSRPYTKAKVIDMIFFREGYKKSGR